MRDLLVLLYEIQSFRDDRIVLVLVLAYLHEDFNHVLHTVTNVALVEHCSEALVHGSVRFGGVLGEECTDFPHETDRNLDRVVRRPLNEEK